MKLSDEIALEYGHLTEGERSTGNLCPQCKGGSSGEKSLSVFRNDTQLRWRCWRSTCGCKGRTYLGTSARLAASAGIKDRVQRVIDYTISPEWPADLLAAFQSKFCLSEATLDAAKWHYTPSAGLYGARVVMPVCGPDGSRRATMFRSYWGHWKKTVLEVLPHVTEQADTPIQAWYRGQFPTKEVVLVEDQVSALRIHQGGVDAVALLGTELTPVKIREIIKQNYKRVVLVLDADMLVKSIEYVTTLRKRIPNIVMLGINKDVKDMSSVEFTAFVNEVIR